MLGWATIPAEIDVVPDEDLAELSLVENMEREDLSDYEIGLSFREMHDSFGKSYDEIGTLVGYSKQHVSNLIAMTRLFDEETLRQNQGLRDSLYMISEHHARLLARIEGERERASALRLVLSEDMSVRDLQRTIQKLGGWFESGQSPPTMVRPVNGGNASNDDLSQIQQLLTSEYELPRKGNFQSFSNFHDFNGNFSLFSSFFPKKMYQGNDAFVKEKKWFFTIAPELRAKIREVSIRFFGDAALATLTVDYRGAFNGKRVSRTTFGTVVFVKKRNWRIVHEHWSKKDSS